MRVGLLLITHDRIGTGLHHAASTVLGGEVPLPTHVIDIPWTCNDPDTIIEESGQHLDALDEGAGVLVLTDLYGSTPGNIASTLSRKHRLALISGVNLPMLLRLYNYADLDIQGLTDKAVEGGKNGIVISDHLTP